MFLKLDRICLSVVLLVFATSAVVQAKPRRSLREDLQYQPGIISAEFLYDKASFPSCHAATIAETDRGLIAAFFGGTAEKNPDVGIWVCRKDRGMAVWTPPFEVANGVQHASLRYPTWNPVLVQASSGPLLLFYKAGPTPKSWWGMLTTSDDGGVTWSRPRRLPEGIDGPVKNKPIWLSDGSLLCGSSTENDGWRIHFERTGDLGKTWSEPRPSTTARPSARSSQRYSGTPTVASRRSVAHEARTASRSSGRVTKAARGATLLSPRYPIRMPASTGSPCAMDGYCWSTTTPPAKPAAARK